jgi:hypothetical protein
MNIIAVAVAVGVDVDVDLEVVEEKRREDLLIDEVSSNTEYCLCYVLIDICTVLSLMVFVTVPYCMYCTVLYCTRIYCTVLYHTVLCCMIGE